MKHGKIIYVYDAMCGWCFGFSPIIKQLHDEYKKIFEFETLSGGMVIADRVGPISETAGYIKQAYRDVEEHTGIEFGKGFLENILEEGSYLYSSELPSVALTIFKNFEPEHSVEFAHQLQHAFFYDGKNLNAVDTYLDLIEPYAVEADEFTEQLGQQHPIDATNMEFQRVRKMGVNGYPSVLFETDESLMTVSRGFQPYASMRKVFDEIKEMQAS